MWDCAVQWNGDSISDFQLNKFCLLPIARCLFMIGTLLKPLPGLLVELILSWLIVWLIEKKNLGVLGLSPTRKRLSAFIVFFFLTAACCSTEILLRMTLASEQWQLNAAFSGSLVLKGTWWTLFSVLFEELIFRGVLLFILIRRIGAVKAIIVSSIAFGIYHWFSFGVVGNIMQMLYIFVITGTMGLLLAYAYSKTFSLYIPIAIHLGWNLTHGFIFSLGPIGNGIFIPVSDQPGVTVSYFTYYFIVLFPMVSMLLLNYFVLSRRYSREIEYS